MAGQRYMALRNILKTSSLLKAAWFFGAAPLVIGILVFFLWVLLRADILMATGAITICAGTVCIVLGAICLAIYLWRSWRSSDITHRRLMRQAAALSGLLLANFVVAGGLVCLFDMIDTSYSVSITNQSALTLKSARVYGGGVDIQLGDISSGSTARKFFWVKGDGTLMFEAMCGNDKVTAMVEGYVTGSMGGNMAVTVDASNQVTVRENRPGLLYR